jgi:phosphate/sulfate permease
VSAKALARYGGHTCVQARAYRRNTLRLLFELPRLAMILVCIVIALAGAELALAYGWPFAVAATAVGSVAGAAVNVTVERRMVSRHARLEIIVHTMQVQCPACRSVPR